ncbi:hypothetical protein BK816_03250 [Boudabousia tangfeifanii]|uniref:Guanylate cyclase domain-containing protein n=1 Tax=Boudabousia tangfeifanii TaxID=1912795 RepID=A0A1D9MJE7_9ACTO|nr:adenylate/guanylate cyclase domain-containing protein [Boudabousia tangfeifanii]AOZ72427.1 hypothetical protein BK816_03250 [Boudabousia tangfeifanii]
MLEGSCAQNESKNHSASSDALQALRTQLLGDGEFLSQSELAARAGTSEADVVDFWRAMGFADVQPDAKIFTSADAEALETCRELIGSHIVDHDTMISLLRAFSYTSDRLALWQVETLVEDQVRRIGKSDLSARKEVLEHINEILPALERAANYAFRRHIYALLARMERDYVGRRISEPQPDRYPLRRSLGFVDMVAYTSTSATLSPSGLSTLIRRFEYLARDVITSRGARIVKTIGDAVLYIADDLETATEVVCALVEEFSAAKDLLPVRASLVEGYVVSRSGDVFGPPVNLASRLVDDAPQGAVCVDMSTAQSIIDSDWGKRFFLEELETQDMHGLGPVRRFMLKPRGK